MNTSINGMKQHRRQILKNIIFVCILSSSVNCLFLVRTLNEDNSDFADF